MIQIRESGPRRARSSLLDGQGPGVQFRPKYKSIDESLARKINEAHLTKYGIHQHGFGWDVSAGSGACCRCPVSSVVQSRQPAAKHGNYQVTTTPDSWLLTVFQHPGLCKVQTARETDLIARHRSFCSSRLHPAQFNLGVVTLAPVVPATVTTPAQVVCSPTATKDSTPLTRSHRARRRRVSTGRERGQRGSRRINPFQFPARATPRGVRACCQRSLTSQPQASSPRRCQP